MREMRRWHWLQLFLFTFFVVVAVACTARDSSDPSVGQEHAAIQRTLGTGLTPLAPGALETTLHDTWLKPAKDCSDDSSCDTTSDPPTCWPYSCAKYRAPKEWEAAFLRYVVGDLAQTIMSNAFKNGGNGGNWWPLSPDGPIYGIVPTTPGGGVRYEMPWAFALHSIGYTIVQYYDAPMDRVLAVLLPISLTGGTPARDTGGRNWGIFIFNMQPTSFHVIEIPHPKADTNTELEGVEAFEASDTLALFIASERHRP